MKNLRNIAAIACVSLLFGCSYTGAFKGTKHIPVESEQHIPTEDSNQINKQQTPTEHPPAQEVTKTPAGTIKIALLVPLSGSHKELGQGLLDAAQLAVFRIGDANITLIPIDTKDSSTGAIEAANQAVAEGVKIILGPIFSASAKAIVKIAADNNIPVVSFSNDKSLAGTGVFAIGLLPEQQISRLVEFTSGHGIKEFTTLLPGDAYGSAISKELNNITQVHPDVSILKGETYKTDSSGRAISLDGHIQQVLDAVSKGKKTDAPVGVLMPASAGVTNSILTSIEQSNFDKTKLQLLGTDQWNNSDLLKNAAMEGAMFTASPQERRVDFESKFRNTYGHDAPKLAALAYDGVALTATLARISGGDFTREAITSKRGFVGVDGIFRLREDGLTERGFAIMAVKNGRAIVIDPAPKSFAQ